MLHIPTFTFNLVCYDTKGYFSALSRRALPSARKKGLCFRDSSEGQTHLKADSLNTRTSCYCLTGVKLPPFPAAISFLGYRWKKSQLTAGFLTPQFTWPFAGWPPSCPYGTHLPTTGHLPVEGRTSGITLPHSASRRTQSDNLALSQSCAVNKQ